MDSAYFWGCPPLGIRALGSIFDIVGLLRGFLKTRNKEFGRKFNGGNVNVPQYIAEASKWVDYSG
jgi:hypothetical protein